MSLFQKAFGLFIYLQSLFLPEKIEIKDFTPQFIIISFDGSYSLPVWQATRSLAKDLKASGAGDVRFTYFISGVYFLSAKDKNLYQAPKQPTGLSLIGFADDQEDINKRVEQVTLAQSEGHEIGSHVNGHFRGFAWNYDDWEKEFNLFEQFTKSAGLKLKLAGFRAPNLSINENLYKLLSDEKFRYDASKVGKWDEWPKKENNLYEFPLGNIPLSGTKNKVISMDYNFFLSQSDAKDIIRKNNPLWKKYYQQIENSYQNYFDHNYQGNRAPIIIGHHFSLWNDSLYFEALKEFALINCVKPEVICTNFSSLADYLDLHPDKISTNSASGI
jgi:peptidoglycan/xylan/chitin deacetylase (PgdA/CDA1 family)